MRREDVKINQFDSSKSARLFVEPEVQGYERVNLAELSRRQLKDQRTSVRQTLPPPERRNGVRLGQPTPLPDQPAQADDADPVVSQNSAVQKPGMLDELITAPLPVSPESDSMRAASAAWYAASSSPIGR